MDTAADWTGGSGWQHPYTGGGQVQALWQPVRQGDCLQPEQPRLDPAPEPFVFVCFICGGTIVRHYSLYATGWCVDWNPSCKPCRLGMRVYYGDERITELDNAIERQQQQLQQPHPDGGLPVIWDDQLGLFASWDEWTDSDDSDIEFQDD